MLTLKRRRRTGSLISFPSFASLPSCFLWLLLGLVGRVSRGADPPPGLLFFLGDGSHVRELSAKITASSAPSLCVDELATALVNDDFCDCADGSDEPRTSACSHVDWHDRVRVPVPTQFVCANAGHVPKSLAPSRVHDGVCDCCDGSEEKPGECPDECFEVGRAWRAAREAAERAIQNGLAQRNESLRTLEASVAAAQKRVDDQRAALKRVEEILATLREHLRLEEDCEYAEQRNAKCAMCVPQPRSRVAELSAVSRQLSGDPEDPEPHVQTVLSDTYNLQESQGQDGGNATPSVVLAKAFVATPVPDADELQCNYRTHQHLHWTNLPAKVVGIWLLPARLLWEAARLPGYFFWPTVANSSTEEHLQHGEEENSLPASSDLLSAMEDAARWICGLFYQAWEASNLRWVWGMFSPAVDKRHRRLEAQILRQFIRTATRETEELRRGAQRQEELALLDTTAPDALLFLLGDECYDLRDNEYRYEVCPFSEVKQNSLSLGKWTEEENPNAFVPGSEARADKYSTRPPAAFTMNFTKGRACHNGVERSSRVHMYCGDTNRVDSVQETELCKYEIGFFSPYVCSEQSLLSLAL